MKPHTSYISFLTKTLNYFAFQLSKFFLMYYISHENRSTAASWTNLQLKVWPPSDQGSSPQPPMRREKSGEYR